MPPPLTADASAADLQCANCGAQLLGEYCHVCGQRRIYHELSVRALLGDAVTHAADFAELKTVRTVAALIRRPGQLTNDYIAGRRAAWLGPLKLYLTIFAITFFLYSAFKSVAVYDISTLAAIDHSGALAKLINDVSAKKHIAPDVFVSEVNTRWHAYASFSQIIYPLLFALVLKVFYWSRRFVEHLIFSLHYQAVAFLIIVIAWPIYYVTGLALTNRTAVLAVVVTLVMVGYLLLAARAVYRQSWPTTIAKGIVLYGAYYLIYIVVTYGTMIAAMSVTLRH